MDEVKVFKNVDFGEVRVVEIDEKPWFCAMDITKALGYNNGRDAIMKHCKEKGVAKRDTLTKGGNQLLSYIDESNVYRLITHSKLPQAERFESWVFDEVLPTIRKHGMYLTENTLQQALSSPDYLLRIVTKYKEEYDKRVIAEQENEKHKLLIEEQKPKVTFANAILGSDNSISVADLAKQITQNGYRIGQKQLFQWLRDNKYLGSTGCFYNKPMQQYMEMGLFELKESMHTENEKSVTTLTTKVTPKGQQYFIDKFIHQLQLHNEEGNSEAV